MDSQLLLRPTAEGIGRVQKLLALTEGDPPTDAAVAACLSSELLVGLHSAAALTTAISVYMRTHECSAGEFVATVLRPTIRAASCFDTLFALTNVAGPPAAKRHCAEGGPHVPDTAVTHISVDMPVCELSRVQLWSIVANAFLCTFEERDTPGTDDLPSITFTEIHRARHRRNYVEITKLRLLFDYFALLAREEHENPTGSVLLKPPAVTIIRSRAPPLTSTRRATGDHRLLPCTIHELGESIDDQDTMLRLDFANRWIGGGALSDGCVQEEITFAQCPELIALRWFHHPLGDDEALVVIGHRQYAAIRAGTYGRDIRYAGCVGMPRLLAGALVAVDALDFRYTVAAHQFTPAAVKREIQKLLSGLLASTTGASVDVAGGNWGCGVFGGDVQLKFLIQWVACGLAEKHLHYFPFDLPYVSGMQPVVDHVTQNTALTVNELLDCLLDPQWLQTASREGAWTALTQWLSSVKGVTVPIQSSDDESTLSSEALDRPGEAGGVSPQHAP